MDADASPFRPERVHLEAPAGLVIYAESRVYLRSLDARISEAAARSRDLLPTLRRGAEVLHDLLKHKLNSPDWRGQAQVLLAGLRRGGCAHNDIKCENLTVAEGRLTLIDFGFATELDAPIPSDWPQGIGRQHRIDIHRFDDRKAIFEALLSAEEDRLDRSIVMPEGSREG